MLNYFISGLLLFFVASGFSQQQAATDSLGSPERFGLRVGIDLSKPLRGWLEEGYRGLELVGDYRLSKNFYIAAEIGTEEKTTTEDFYTFTTSGSYLKGGFNYNVYDNWYGMENLIYVGFRYGIATHRQTIDSYTLYQTNPYWGETGLPGDNPIILQTYKGLNAHWVEAVLGIQAELLNNLYIGASIRINRLITDTAADTFPNLWIPGFNKVTGGSAFGVGYNYSLSYFIPLYKKAPKKTGKKL